MILIKTGDEQVPKVFTSPHTLIYITCENYCFDNHIFCEGSVTTIVWPFSGNVWLKNCKVHDNATVVVSGMYLFIGRRTILHKGANICGLVKYMSCFPRIPNELNVKISRFLRIYACDNDWSESELDMICRNRNVEYYNDNASLAPRFINRMQSNYKFYARMFNEYPYPFEARRLRTLQHSLLAMVSARDAKRVGVHSALRKLPRYVLMMCGEMLV